MSEKKGRGAVVAPLPWKSERAEYPPIPSEQNKSWGLVFSDLYERRRKPTCLVIHKEISRMSTIWDNIDSKKVTAAAMRKKQNVKTRICHYV